MDNVVIAGVGIHPFGRFDLSYRQLGAVAARDALADAGIGPARRVIVSYLERARQAGLFNAEALVELLGMVGGIAAALGSHLGSLDLNPMIVTGDGLTGVDALAVLTAEIP